MRCICSLFGLVTLFKYHKLSSGQITQQIRSGKINLEEAENLIKTHKAEPIRSNDLVYLLIYRADINLNKISKFIRHGWAEHIEHKDLIRAWKEAEPSGIPRYVPERICDYGISQNKEPIVKRNPDGSRYTQCFFWQDFEGHSGRKKYCKRYY